MFHPSPLLVTNRREVIIQKAWFLLLFLSFGPCDESLPVYQEPERILDGRIEGAYVLTIQDNSLKVYLKIKNVFDETLQGQAILKGTVEIISARDPQVRKTLVVGPGNIISARGYERNTGRLTIDPGDTITLGVSWDFTADDRGVDLRSNFFQYIKDVTCDSRCLAFTEDFILTGDITVYPQRAPLRMSVNFPVCFVSRWIKPNFCPPIITSAVCNLRPPQLAQRCFPREFIPVDN